MELKYDAQADAIYVELSSKPYAYGKDLDDQRRIDYSADGSPIGVELLCVTKGAIVNGLPYLEEIARLLVASGIIVYYIEQVSQSETGSQNTFILSTRLAEASAIKDRIEVNLELPEREAVTA